MKPLEFEKVTVADARTVLDGSPKDEEKVDPTARRAPQQKSRLSELTFAWLATLPPTVRPVELPRRFPRIANSICALWRRVAQCEEYLDSLIVDQRGGRQGFPADVAQELTTLRDYYAQLHPGARSTWDFVERSK